MKQTIYILTITLGLLSCNSKTEKNINQTVTDSLEISSTDQNQSNIYIKEKSKYSNTFIDELTASNYNEPIKLIDNYIIVGNDTTQFPSDIEINKKTVFTGTRNNQFYELVLIRISLTEIVFAFFIRENNEEIVLPSKEGKATLGAMFFLAPEGDEDEVTGEGYGSFEYWEKDDKCWVSIRVGLRKDGNGKQRAKISFGCEDNSKKTMTLDDCPTLRTE